MTKRFAALALLLAGCGFTDKPREKPPDLGVPPDRGAVDARIDTVSIDVADGPVDAGNDCATTTDGAPSCWICMPAYYGDSTCDCGCGAPDPDCAGAGCASVGCCAPATCVSLGCFYCGPDSVICPFPDGPTD